MRVLRGKQMMVRAAERPVQRLNDAGVGSAEGYSGFPWDGLAPARYRPVGIGSCYLPPEFQPVQGPVI